MQPPRSDQIYFGFLHKQLHFIQNAEFLAGLEKESLGPAAGSGGAISRAYYKLAELHERTRVSLQGVAVDVGASPGGKRNLCSHHQSTVCALSTYRHLKQTTRGNTQKW